MATAQTTDDVSLDGSDFHKGRWRGVLMAVLGVGAVIGVAVYLLLPGDREAYSAVGKTVNGLDQQGFDAFMGCAVGARNLDRVKDNVGLQNMIHQSSVAGKRYGKHLRDDCMPKLDELSSGLERLIPPESLQSEVGDLTDSVAKLRSGWSGYIAHLEGLDGGFDPEDEDAERTLGQAIEAWRDYKVALHALNKKLKEKLEA